MNMIGTTAMKMRKYKGMKMTVRHVKLITEYAGSKKKNLIESAYWQNK